jgi:ComF family protein
VTVARPHSLGRTVRVVAGALVDLAVPRRCGLCARFDTFLCPRCAGELPVASPPRCPTCWGLLGDRRCSACAAVLVHSLEGVRSSYRLEDGARELVHHLKYNGLSALAEPMGALMAATLDAWGIRPEVVAPVPLHDARRRARGFNQAALLARSCAETAGLAMRSDALRRTRTTQPQVRARGAGARRENVAGAFAARAGIAGRSVLLIDDVCTTGATLRACADALRAAGAARVYGLTFAHED